MSRINRGRLILSGIVAGLVWTVLSSLITAYLSQEFVTAVPGRRLIAPPGSLVALLLVLNLLMGCWAMWLYAAIRPRFGPGPATAALAGFSWWIITSLVDATWGSFGFVRQHALLAPMIASLPALILAALAGASLYREE
jgi:hypothetical protein